MSIKKLPTLPNRQVKRYITDMKVTAATRATSTVRGQSTGWKPLNRWREPSITRASAMATVYSTEALLRHQAKPLFSSPLYWVRGYIRLKAMHPTHRATDII